MHTQQKQQNNSTINNKTQLLLVRGVKHINPHRILRIKGLRWERRLRSRSTPRIHNAATMHHIHPTQHLAAQTARL